MTMPQPYFTVPLSRTAHQQAQQHYSNYADSHKARRIYLNQLAVYAVDYYLRCLGFETDYNNSDSSNPIVQILSETADLVVKNWGKLECRFVLPDAEDVRIPPEVWQDRNGYIAVQLNADLTQAHLLGFVPEVTQEKISFSELRSLDKLIEHLHQPVESVLKSSSVSQTIVRLSQWFNNVVDSGWETLEDLCRLPQQQLALGFRSPAVLRSRKPNPVKVERGKLINLEKNGDRVALLVGLLRKNEPNLDISVELFPGNQNYLPPDLQLIILDERDRAVMQAEAGGSEGLEFQFSGEPGEQFSVKVALGEFSLIEQFII
jgi:hypothetical protein